ncbi:MAG: hypothetical protein E6Q89_00645 [Bacteroidia bacterium]|nr:MAG: hypothetical protein E6Q89_00645 [Bacteroidia bacterium]
MENPAKNFTEEEVANYISECEINKALLRSAYNLLIGADDCDNEIGRICLRKGILKEDIIILMRAMMQVLE